MKYLKIIKNQKERNLIKFRRTLIKKKVIIGLSKTRGRSRVGSNNTLRRRSNRTQKSENLIQN